MRIEYFQLIDRIIDLNLNDLTIRVEANVPTESTIFEGHFPGRPLMPGVLLIEIDGAGVGLAADRAHRASRRCRFSPR